MKQQTNTHTNQKKTTTIRTKKKTIRKHSSCSTVCHKSAISIEKLNKKKLLENIRSVEQFVTEVQYL